jgi:hypothetical protein
MERVRLMVPSKLVLRRASHPSELFFSVNIISISYAEHLSSRGLTKEKVELPRLLNHIPIKEPSIIHKHINPAIKFYCLLNLLVKFYLRASDFDF